mmetsp:Transcript_65065/g.172321  ORF Transcript_65065/g.172321 Transcript_65065/m.172321 type:complete len:345 (-) Transcript_65065:319-1353(-)
MSRSPGQEQNYSGTDLRAHAHQLTQRVVHLEADLELLQRRKIQLERENETFAAAAQRPDLEAKLAAALASNARLEAECERHRAADLRRFELEAQQDEIARSFSELQLVVSQLVARVGSMNMRRAPSADDAGLARTGAIALRSKMGRSTKADRGGSRDRSCLCGQRRGCPKCWTRTGHKSPPPQPQRRRSPVSSDDVVGAQCAELQVECQFLRQRLASEERACARVECQVLQGRLTSEAEACARARASHDNLVRELHSERYTADAPATHRNRRPGDAASPSRSSPGAKFSWAGAALSPSTAGVGSVEAGSQAQSFASSAHSLKAELQIPQEGFEVGEMSSSRWRS